MIKICEFLARNLRGFIIRFLSRELHRIAGGPMGIKTKGNNQSITGGCIPQGVIARGSEDSGAYKFGIDRMASQFKLHENVLREGPRAMQTAQGKY